MKIARSTPRTRLRLNPLEARDVPATLFVDDDKAQFRNAAFTSIQAAVDAADAGDTIRVAPGTYREQVTIADDKDGVSLVSVVPLAAVIKAPAAVSETRTLVSVDGATGVSLTGFTVAGPGTSNGALDIGILVDGGGSATIRNNWVRDVRDPSLTGGQTGVGIQVGGETAGTATVVDNLVSSYQKGGIVVDGDGSSATLTRNTVVGAGPTGTLAQNGIQVSDGATATVRRNLVAGNSYTGDGFAAGILLFDAGATEVADNLVIGNQIGILVDGTTASVLVDGNDVVGSGDAGINVFGGSGAVVSRNRVSGTADDGILLEGETTGVLVDRNTVTGSGGNGIAVVDGSSANVVTRNTVRRSGGEAVYDDGTGTGNVFFGNKTKS